jgi:hypothetical protein
VLSDQETGTLERNLFAPVCSDDQDGDLQQLYLRSYLKQRQYSSLRLSSNKSPSSPSPPPSSSPLSQSSSPSPSSCREVQRLRCLEVDIDRERILYTIAAVHLRSNYNWKLYLPTLVLSLSASILAFLQTAVSLSHTRKNVLAAAIGILGLLSSTLLEAARRLQLETRATIYMNVAIKLTIIISDLKFHPLDPAADLKILHEKILRDYQKAKEKSKSDLIPHRITSAFEALDAYITATLRPAVQLMAVHRCTKLTRMKFDTVCMKNCRPFTAAATGSRSICPPPSGRSGWQFLATRTSYFATFPRMQKTRMAGIFWHFR